MIITDMPCRSFEKILIDFCGPMELTKGESQYVLIIQCNLSKYCVLTPVGEATAQEGGRIITQRFIYYFGRPRTIISDQGTHFINELLEAFVVIFRLNKYSRNTGQNITTIGGKTRNISEPLYEIIGINYETHNVKLQKGDHTRVLHMNKIKRRYKTPPQIPDGESQSEPE